jgi:hypothetical protein
MITTLEMEQLIYKDAAHTVENADWIERFYELWMERYHALNIVKSPSQVMKLSKAVLLQLLREYQFDELHLFKIHEGANVFALLKDKGDGYWSYQFVIIYQSEPEKIIQCCNTVEEVKDHFNHKEPILEIPLPSDRKYLED